MTDMDTWKQRRDEARDWFMRNGQWAQSQWLSQEVSRCEMALLRLQHAALQGARVPALGDPETRGWALGGPQASDEQA